MARSSGSKKTDGTEQGLISAVLGNKWLRRFSIAAVVLAVLAFAVEGGEYGTSDLLVQRDQKAVLEAQVKELQDSVSVLRAEIKAVTTDPERLERIAREEYGMVKGDKEILYR